MTRRLTRDEQRDLERRVRIAIDNLEPLIRRYGIEAIEAEAGDALRSRPLEGASRTDIMAARIVHDGARAMVEKEQGR